MKSSKPRVVVVGSFNMDLVVRALRRPNKGETLFGTEFGMFPGGKGFNQAIAAARLGAAVSMIGRVGADYFGDLFLAALQAEHVRADGVVRDTVNGTGVGLPVILDDGDNSIIGVPRANMQMTVADVERVSSQIAEADVLLLQLEVPQAVSVAAARIGQRAHVRVILNPAPAAQLDAAFYELVDVLTPNEQETRGLTGIVPASPDAMRQAADIFLNRGIRSTLFTLGERGAYLATRGERQMIENYRVQVVDTTGAGDAFCGGLAVALARGESLSAAARFANAVAALSVTKMGASPSMPTQGEVGKFLARV